MHGKRHNQSDHGLPSSKTSLQPLSVLPSTPLYGHKLSPIASQSTSTKSEETAISAALSKQISETVTDKPERRECSRILRNVIHISAAFTIVFSAFHSMANLQSSINISQGMGTVSLASIYVSIVASSLFIPSIMIRRLTVKWTMCVSMLGHSAYIAAQFYPRFYTLIPAAVVLGMGSAPMWISQSTYLAQVARVYSGMMHEKKEVSIIRVFGIFFLFFETSQLWGNLVSSLVLSYTKYKPVSEDDPHLSHCGASFCLGPEESSAKMLHFVRPAPRDLYTLSAIYLVCAFCASVLIAVNVDPLTRYGEKTRPGSITTLPEHKLWVATFLHLKHPYTLLLFPLSMWCGFEQGFITADYTQAFVSCAYSIHHVGYVMMTHGVIAAMFSMSLSTITEITGRLSVFSFGASLNLITVTVMLRWHPTPTDPILFYTVSGLWGMCDAVWQTQLNALYGSLFPNDEEVAFSCYRLFEASGFALAYGFSPYFCIRPELYTMTAFLVLGMVCYYIIEWKEHLKKKRVRRNPPQEAPPQNLEERAELPNSQRHTDLFE